MRWAMPSKPPHPAKESDSRGLRELALDCAHAGEPNFSVSAAFEAGELDPARFAAWQKLRAETRYHERSVDQRAAAENKRKWKVIHKAMRHHPKYDR